MTERRYRTIRSSLRVINREDFDHIRRKNALLIGLAVQGFRLSDVQTIYYQAASSVDR